MAHLFFGADASEECRDSALTIANPVDPATSATTATEELAVLARESLTALRLHHRTVASAADWLFSEKIEGSVWQDYHLGMAFGLSQRFEGARRHFRLAMDECSATDEWGPPLSEKCAAYAILVEDPQAFRAALQERISATRAELKLRVMDSLAFD